ncbi:19131_t:CDS:2 [Gigaspora margarita]|uniref:19131_t:CDS:1 n=1 Tax=Gigaspora margarita TaxID=4874 RepID=A0ABN7W385_GIGMA|nr:19131_t:CDS:2 [Gigaspora margarita]
MPIQLRIRKLQQKKAEIACSAFVSYSLIDIDSSEEYVYSSDKSSNNNFMKFDNSNKMNLIIEQLYLVSIDSDEEPDKESDKKPDEKLDEELDEEPDEELDNKSGNKLDKKIDKKKIHSAIEFVDGVMNKALSKTKKACYLTIFIFVSCFCKVKGK